MKSSARPKLFFPIRIKIIITFLMLSLLLIIAESCINYIYSKAGLEDRIFSDLTAIAESRAYLINMMLEEDFEDVKDVAGRMALRQNLQTVISYPDNSDTAINKIKESLSAAKDAIRTIDQIDIVGLDGKILASTIPENHGKDIADNMCYLNGRKGPYLCDPYYEKSSLAYVMTAPISGYGKYDKDVIGVAKVKIGLKRLDDILCNYAGLGDTGESVIAKRLEDEIIFLGPLRGLRNRDKIFSLSMASSLAKPMKLALEKTPGVTSARDYRGKEVFAAYRYIPLSGWGLVVKVDKDEALKPVAELLKNIILIDCALFLFAILVITRIARFVSGPLKILREGTEEIAKGNLGYYVHIGTLDELGELAASFNKMAASLQEMTVTRDKLNREIVIHKSAEDALKDYAFEVSDLYNNAPCGYHSLDEDGTFIRINDTELKWLGYSRDEMIGKKKFSDIMSVEGRETFGRTFSSFKNTGTAKDIEYDLVRKDGSILPVLLNAVAVKDKDGNFMMSRATMFDISDRKKVELARKEAAEAKSHFTSMVSHELRTPLAAIKEGISIVVDGVVGKITDDQATYLGIAKSNVDRLARLINDILDFQKIESGRIEFRIKEDDIVKAINDIYRTMSPLAEQKGIAFELKIEEGIPPARFDYDKIMQVLANLVSNAIKFTGKGGVSVAAFRESGFVHVTVSDTGIGIKEHNIPKLFKSFEQLEDSIESKGGTGLGLAISKEIIDRHNGAIWAESEHGAGTMIHFKLPI
jgi:PAS domain S-box-containing protein